MQRSIKQSRSPLTLLVLLCTATVAACESQGADSAVPMAMSAPERAIMERNMPAASPGLQGEAKAGRGMPARSQARIAYDRAVPPTSVSAPSDSFSTQSGPIVPDMIIRNGSASIRVDSLEQAIATVRELISRLNGYVGNVAVTTGENQVRSATLELKIPATSFDEAMAGMKPIGKVESSMSTTADVGEEFVDISARMANGKRLEERLISLLSSRTGTLEDVLSVERELARVREEIERYEGRIRYLKSRVATSTITVNVHEKPPLVSNVPGTSVLGEAFATMWRNFVHFIAGSISALGYLIPLALIFAAIWALGKRYKWWSGRARRSIDPVPTREPA